MSQEENKSEAREKPKKVRPFQSVSKRMIKAILIISGLVTTFLTAFSFYLDYSQEMDLLEKTLVQIEKASVSTLVDSIWQMDEVQINTTVDGVERLNDVVRVELVDEEGKEIYSKGDESKTEDFHKIVRVFPLIFDQEGEKTNIGTLKVIATREFIMEKLRQKVIIFFISQAAKTLLVSFLILMFTGWLITSQIARISKFFQSFDPNETGEANRLLRGKTRGFYTDEIDNLVENINKMAKQNLDFTKQIQKTNEILEEKVEARTMELFQKKEDTLAILNNLHQGIMTLNSGGAIGDDYSVFLCKIFNQNDLKDRNGIDLLFDGAEVTGDEKQQCLSALEMVLGEPYFEFEINEHCFTKSIQRRNHAGEMRKLELDWIPILNKDETTQKMLVSIRDVTELNKLKEEAARLEKEKKCMIELLTCDKNQFQFFCQDSKSIIDTLCLSLKEEEKPMTEQVEQLMRHVHTLKGNSRTFGLSFVTDLAHRFESTIKQHKENINYYVYNVWIKELKAIRDEIAYYQTIAEKKIFQSSKNQVKLSEKESLLLKKILFEYKNMKEMRSGLEKVLKPILFQSTLSAILAPAVEATPALASQVNKPAPNLKISDGYYEFDQKMHQLLANIFGHLINNSMDHGIESPETREKQGKDPIGNIEIEVIEKEGYVVIEFQDDGKGINLQKVLSKRPKSKDNEKLPAPTWETVVDLLIRSGFSTKEKVTQISGRGVGLDAVAAFTEQIGGSFEIVPKEEWNETKEHMPVKFRFTFYNSFQRYQAG